MKRLWLVLCILGTVVPYAVFIPWLVQNGLNLRLLVQQATANPIAVFAWLDVLIAALVVLILAGRRIAAGDREHWWVVAGTCAVGVSLGLPLYLYLVEGN
jgi:hypothetical protein